jgi:hypothetical protein
MALLTEALRRCLAASEVAVVARAIDEAAVEFYERHGILRSLMPIETVRSALNPNHPSAFGAADRLVRDCNTVRGTGRRRAPFC